MVLSQGFLGYALTSVMGPIVAEIFEGPHFGAIFGTLMVALIGGGAAGPWVAGVLHDATGSYARLSPDDRLLRRFRGRDLDRGRARCAWCLAGHRRHIVPLELTSPIGSSSG